MKISIEAELLLVATDIVAESGQHLMVVNGTGVGVYTGRLPTERAVAAGEVAAKPAARSLPAPARHTKGRSALPARNPKGNNSATLGAYTLSVLARLQGQSKPMSFADICGILGIAPDDRPARLKANGAVKTLVARGDMVVVDKVKGAGQRGMAYLYVMADHAPTRAANGADHDRAVPLS